MLPLEQRATRTRARRTNHRTSTGEPIMRRTAVVAALVVAATSAIVVANRANARPVAELDDPTIVAIFDAANTADIETGALGAERSSSKEVRDYGTMLSQVHVAVRQ